MSAMHSIRTAERSSYKRLLIWDKESIPPQGDWDLILWRSFGDGSFPSAYSIPRLVEEHADSLRSRYLGWIYELGEAGKYPNLPPPKRPWEKFVHISVIVAETTAAALGLPALLFYASDMLRSQGGKDCSREFLYDRIETNYGFA